MVEIVLLIKKLNSYNIVIANLKKNWATSKCNVLKIKNSDNLECFAIFIVR